MIQPRQSVKELKAYSPPLEGRRERIRLDFNENTVGFPEQYAQESSTHYTCYPEYQAFLSQLSVSWGIPEENLLLTNGSDEALFLSAFTFIEPGQDAALTMSPTFSLIPHYLRLVGSQLIEVFYMADLQYNTVAIEQTLKAQPIKLAIFASPDNPTGAMLPKESIRQWCRLYSDTLFVIDEAYAEYADASALPLIQEFANLIVTRTFSKAWGLAGLRLGVMVGSSELMEILRRVRSPYSVNAMAIQTAARLLLQMPMIQAEARATMARKAWVLDDIRQRGYSVISGQANFFMIGIGLDVAGFCQFFEKHGLLLRNQSARPGLRGMVRVSIGTQAEMERFLQVLDQVRQKRVLLFDMDDTLVDTSQSFDVTINRLVERYAGQGLLPGELATLRAEGGFNDDWEATVELLRRRGVHKTYDEIAGEAQSLYLSLAPEVETWLAEPELFERLKQTHRLGVATGRCRVEYTPIWRERFEPLFETVICQDDDPHCAKKPSPELLKKALSLMDAEGGLYVGNSVDDMCAAKAAGLTAVGITHTNTAETLLKAGADFVIASLDELLVTR